jgi:hypothetical protein
MRNRIAVEVPAIDGNWTVRVLSDAKTNQIVGIKIGDNTVRVDADNLFMAISAATTNTKDEEEFPDGI